MAEIIQSLLPGGGQALRLYNEQWGRRMEIGCAWGKIRVAVRFTVQATSPVNSSGLVIGVSQGTTDMFRSSNTTDFIGANLGSTLQATNWNYNAGPPPFSFAGGFTPIAVRRVGNTNTIVAPGGSINVYLPLNPSRGIFAVDIEKSHASMRVKPLAIDGGTGQARAQTDLNFGNFMYNVDDDASTTNLIGHSPNVLSVPYDGNFYFDSVNIDWNNGIQPIDIYDILVVRFY
jgi:hypothetical protein